MAYTCPKCQATVLSRKVQFCTTCKQPLPVEFRLSAEELAALEKETEAAKKRATELKGSSDAQDLASQTIYNLPSPGDVDLG
jgi:hypothetical protein